MRDAPGFTVLARHAKRQGCLCVHRTLLLLARYAKARRLASIIWASMLPRSHVASLHLRLPPTQVKQQVLLSATEAAEMILRVDEIVKCAPRQRQE